MERFKPPIIALGRLLIAALFLWDGALLLSAPSLSIAYIGGNLPFPTVAFGGAVAIELVGGIALAIGFMTRWAALALALFCLATALFFHTNWADIDMKIHFFKNLAMMGGLLQLVAWGGGGWSWDARRAKS